jgi:TorA maturation chaperone TorD
MPGAPADAAPGLEVAPEDLLRAQCYRLLARFLTAPPNLPELQAAAALSADRSELGRTVNGFAEACAEVRSIPAAQGIAREFHDLFIGLTRGELIPYASYYLTGFLNEKPLAKLRQDMARLGVARSDGLGDPEDHIASLCEMMAGFIDGAFGCPLTLEEQKAFFNTHLGAWVPVFFRDLEAQATSRLYARLGAVGRAFCAIEEGAFAMVEDERATAR